MDHDDQVELRRHAAAQALASVRADGGEPSSEVKAITERWIQGQITTREMERQVGAIYGIER